MPQSTLRELSRQAVRQRVSDIAVELFAERGYDATTVEEIAEAAGMSERTFFRYFPTKDEVFFSRAESDTQELVEHARSRPIEEAPWVALQGAIEHALTSLNSEAEFARAKQFREILAGSPTLMAHQFSRLSDSLRAVSDALWERWIAVHGTETNSATDDRDGRLLIQALVGSMLGAITEIMPRAEQLPSEERLQLVRGVLAAIRPAREDLGGPALE